MTYWLKIYAVITILIFLSAGGALFASIAVQRASGFISRTIGRQYVANKVAGTN